MKKLVSSKAFWTAIIDIAISTAVYFGGKYLTPEYFEDVKFVVFGVFQPLTAVLLASFFVQDVKKTFMPFSAKIAKDDKCCCD